MNENQDVHEPNTTTSLSSHGFVLPKSSRTYTVLEKCGHPKLTVIMSVICGRIRTHA